MSPSTTISNPMMAFYRAMVDHVNDMPWSEYIDRRYPLLRLEFSYGVDPDATGLYVNSFYGLIRASFTADAEYYSPPYRGGYIPIDYNALADIGGSWMAPVARGPEPDKWASADDVRATMAVTKCTLEYKKSELVGIKDITLSCVGAIGLFSTGRGGRMMDEYNTRSLNTDTCVSALTPLSATEGQSNTKATLLNVSGNLLTFDESATQTVPYYNRRLYRNILTNEIVDTSDTAIRNASSTLLRVKHGTVRSGLDAQYQFRLRHKTLLGSDPRLTPIDHRTQLTLSGEDVFNADVTHELGQLSLASSEDSVFVAELTCDVSSDGLAVTGATIHHAPHRPLTASMPAFVGVRTKLSHTRTRRSSDLKAHPTARDFFRIGYSYTSEVKLSNSVSGSSLRAAPGGWTASNGSPYVAFTSVFSGFEPCSTPSTPLKATHVGDTHTVSHVLRTDATLSIELGPPDVLQPEVTSISYRAVGKEKRGTGHIDDAGPRLSRETGVSVIDMLYRLSTPLIFALPSAETAYLDGLILHVDSADDAAKLTERMLRRVRNLATDEPLSSNDAYIVAHTKRGFVDGTFKPYDIVDTPLIRILAPVLDTYTNGGGYDVKIRTIEDYRQIHTFSEFMRYYKDHAAPPDATPTAPTASDAVTWVTGGAHQTITQDDKTYINGGDTPARIYADIAKPGYYTTYEFRVNTVSPPALKRLVFCQTYGTLYDPFRTLK